MNPIKTSKIIIALILFPVLSFCQTANDYAVSGIAKSQNNDFTGAIADYNKSIALDSLQAVVFYNRAVAKSKLKDYKGAILDYTRAIALKSDAETYFNRGLLKFIMKDYSLSIGDFDIVIELQKDYGKAYLYRGIAKLSLSDKENGCDDLEKAKALKITEADEFIHDYCN